METSSEFIIGRNSVREAIKSGAQIERILLIKDCSDGSIREILSLARDAKIIIREVTRTKMDEICATMGPNGKMGNHQGIAAQIPAFEYSQPEDIFALAESRGEKPFIIILDSVQDPQNLGSVIRSAEALGAHGIIIGKRRSASLTTAVYKVSCGAAQYIPIVKVTNLNRTIEEIKAQNVWVIAADMGGQEIQNANLTGAVALVIGGEDEGVSRLTKELCDMTVRINMNGKTTSLNAACAASIMMYEKIRQDATNIKGAGGGK